MDQTQPAITALLTAIPDDVRGEFQTFYQAQLAARMQDAHATPDSPLGVDPTAIERQFIDDLIRAAEGRDTPDGQGAVPTGRYLYRIRVPERDPRADTPPHPARRSTTPTSRELTVRWLAAGVIVVLLLAYGLGSLLRRTPSTTANAETAPTAATSPAAPTAPPILPTTLGVTGEEGAVTVADPTSLEIRRADGSSVVLRVVPSSSVLGGSWTPTVEQDQAAWLSGTVINSVFCLSPSATDLIDSLKRGSPILMRPASGELRRYEVMRVRTVGRQQVEVLDQRRAGMTLLACGTEGTTRTVVEAVYRPATVERPVQALGTNAALADLARVQLQRVEPLSATAELPPGLHVVQLHVEIANLSTAELAWTDLADQLEIAGSVAEAVPGVPEPPLGPQETRRVRFRYRVPAQGGAALWRVTAATGDSVTVRVTLPPAPVVSQLQATLRAEEVRQVGSGQAARISLTATVTNPGSEPRTLDAGAVGVWQGATALPLHVESTPLPLLVPPGATTPLTLVVERPDTPAALTIHIGPQRWQVTIP